MPAGRGDLLGPPASCRPPVTRRVTPAKVVQDACHASLAPSYVAREARILLPARARHSPHRSGTPRVWQHARPRGNLIARHVAPGPPHGAADDPNRARRTYTRLGEGSGPWRPVSCVQANGLAKGG